MSDRTYWIIAALATAFCVATVIIFLPSAGA